MQTEDKINSVDGVPIMTEAIGFSSDAMVVCLKCAKPNPPNRLNCLYCGVVLELPAEVAKSLLFRPSETEEWEPGVNLVIVGGMERASIDAIGATVDLNHDILVSLRDADAPIPLLRVRHDEAEEVSSRISAAGLSIERVTDADLQLQQPPTRLKGLWLSDDLTELLLFNSEEGIKVDPSDVVLIIAGAIFKSSSEATVKTKRKETRHVDEKFTASDHAVIDLYTAADRNGFRILPHGFDFSCLGTRKSLLAVENLTTLKEVLRETFSNAVFDDSYLSKLPILDLVWPRTIENTSKGIQRVGWKLERSVGEIVSNEKQFTRYSRMRRELI